MTVPVGSNPLLPALPDIWVNSPGNRFANPVPSCFAVLLNTTVLVGRFNPIAKVSVANRTLTKVLANKISMHSLTIGNKPPWWTAIPLLNISAIFKICGSSLSSFLSAEIALSMNMWISDFSLAVQKSTLLIVSAYSSHFFLENTKITVGRRLFPLRYWTKLVHVFLFGPSLIAPGPRVKFPAPPALAIALPPRAVPPLPPLEPAPMFTLGGAPPLRELSKASTCFLNSISRNFLWASITLKRSFLAQINISSGTGLLGVDMT